jgi:hypothetical protein
MRDAIYLLFHMSTTIAKPYATSISSTITVVSYPPQHPILFLHPTIYLPVKNLGVSIKPANGLRSWYNPLLVPVNLVGVV